jgi:hypothetical protein
MTPAAIIVALVIFALCIPELIRDERDLARGRALREAEERLKEERLMTGGERLKMQVAPRSGRAVRAPVFDNRARR